MSNVSLKWLLLLGLCVLLVHVQCALPPEEGVCTSDTDCAAEECCVGTARRRFIFFNPTKGICRPLRFQGFSCHVFLTTETHNHGLHVDYCPCDEGLECRGTTVDALNPNNVIHHDPKCLPKEAA
ncbi:prokineticin Bm8-d-like [Mya arenaria]|uniref:prokineticin Bm8-d-like n=1 Tax=Mya arenaria TaxID=6604 RepID=UPI0022E5E472|nr:prokineticin Bm8-d-like [Mya arenaria]